MHICIQKLVKKIGLLSLLLCLGLQTHAQQALSTSLESGASKLGVGQTVVVNLYLEPEPNNSIYTASVNLVYDPAKLDLVSAIVDPYWLELKMNDVHLTDVINGLIVRTAGYPNGFLGRSKFVTYTFKTREAGSTKIMIAAGQAYNDNNTNVGVRNSELNLLIGDTDSSTEIKDKEPKILDLSLSIKGNNAFYRQEPYTFTLYHKKEEKPQQAITKIWLFDENWKVHHEDEKLWRTDMDNILNFVIPADTLEVEGNFKLIAKVRYEDGQEYEIAEKDLGVLSNGKTWFTKNASIFMPFFWIFVFISIIHHFFVEREIYFKIHKYIRKEKSGNVSRKKRI